MYLAEMHRMDIMHIIYGSPLLVVLFFVNFYYYFENAYVLSSEKVMVVELRQA
jgi:hypothetical protein